MENPSNNQEPQSPVAIAREVFRRLVTRRIAPTPEAYRDVYDEVAGGRQHPCAEKVLENFAATLSRGPTELAGFGSRFRQALELRDWQTCSENLDQLLDKHLLPMAQTKPSALPVAPASRKAGGRRSGRVSPPPGDDAQTRMLRDLLVRTLSLAAGSLQDVAPELAEETNALAAAIKDVHDEPALDAIGARLKQLCHGVESKRGNAAEERELLAQLFKLLLENIEELLEDGSWLRGRIAAVQALLSGPVDRDTLRDATLELKEVIRKQGMLKDRLTEAKAAIKQMMLTFIDQLGIIASSTGDYHAKIDQYAQKISVAQDISELGRIIESLMQETRLAQENALHSRDQMLLAQHRVQEAESRIHELEAKLEQMSGLVREDQLTGSLNRRGLDDVLRREVARAERRKLPLCVAMLDLDDFKHINDTLGHAVGDEVLIHMVQVVRDSLRTMDVVARFGGEEFLVVLPDTDLDNAARTIARLQKELANRIFVHGHGSLSITFSAGVALHVRNEDPALMINRADQALYKAKRAGKNCVVAAR